MINEINFYFFNVNHGDSIVIEIISELSQYILIDCNIIKENGKNINPAYDFLKSKNVKILNSIIITHFHRDHYNGIDDILKNFQIKQLVIPPFLSTNSKQYNKIITKFKEKIKNFVNRTNEDELITSISSLTYLLNFISENNSNYSNNSCQILEASGHESIIRFPDINNLSAKIFLPLRRIKSILHDIILNDKYDFDFYPEMNESSIVICFECFEKIILLGSDSTYNQWFEHKRIMSKYGKDNLNINVLKSPHHGSKLNNKKENYNYFFKLDDNNMRYLIISADGIKHPDLEQFELIKNYDLKPYCTNLSNHCISINLDDFKNFKNIPSEFNLFLSQYLERKPSKCQGNITLNLNQNNISIKNETGIKCVYRI